MIFPYSFSYMTPEALQVVSERLGKPNPVTHPINPAILCGSMGLQDWRTVIGLGKGELGHFYLSFYIEAEDIYDILSLSSLQMLKLDDNAYVLTANMLGWRDVVVHGLSKDTTTEVREIVNYILAYLRDNGFDSMFSKYTRKNLAFDGTIILEE